MRYATKVLILISVIVLALGQTDGYKILCAFPTMFRSHFISVEYLMKALAEKGHSVTVINQYPLEKQLANYREVIIPPSKFHNKMVKELTINTGSSLQIFITMYNMLEYIIEDCQKLLQDPQVKLLLSEETFDLVIVQSLLGDSLSGLSSHFNCPLVFYTSFRTTFEILDLAGAPTAVSYIPYYLADYPEVITFVDRVMNMIFYILDYNFIRLLCAKYHKIIYERNFPSTKYPSYAEAVSNASLYFVCDHFSQTNIRPLTPNIIEVAGLQLKDSPTPLPDDLQKWMDSSKDGVIFFSMGSNMKSDAMRPEIKETILKSFGKLKQNVLWKLDKLDIANLPNNIRIEKWVPQIDILQHSNLKLFVTHGGLGSVTDAKVYGVPLLLIPIYGDQMGNAKTVENGGWGVKIPYDNLTEPLLSDSIAEVLNNPKYRNQAMNSAKLFRDRPLTPMQTAIFWVEYVIRHRGAHHMRSKAKKLNFFQLHSLDVIGFIAIVMLLIIFPVFLMIKCLVRKLLFVILAKRKVE